MNNIRNKIDLIYQEHTEPINHTMNQTAGLFNYCSVGECNVNRTKTKMFLFEISMNKVILHFDLYFFCDLLGNGAFFW